MKDSNQFIRFIRHLKFLNLIFLRARSYFTTVHFDLSAAYASKFYLDTQDKINRFSFLNKNFQGLQSTALYSTTDIKSHTYRDQLIYQYLS